MDFKKLAGTAANTLLSSSNKQDEKKSDSENKDTGSGNSFDVGNIASLAGNFLGNGNNSNDNSDLVSSAIKMALGSGGSGGFNSGNVNLAMIMTAFKSIFGGGDGNAKDLASQGHQAMGLAAAYKAFQSFQGGSSNKGGNDKLVAMAVSEAKGLFDQHSKEGGKADEKETLATAAQAAMSLLK